MNLMKTHIRTFFKIMTCLGLCISLSGCLIKPYRFDLKQGNPLTMEQIEQVRPGMSEEHVHYVLGTPMLRDVFHEQRWDYVYLHRPNKGKPELHRFAIYFENGQVERMTSEPYPSVV